MSPFRACLIPLLASLLATSFFAIGSPIPAERLFIDQQIHSLDFSPNGKYISAKLKDENGHFFNIINAKTKLSQPVVEYKKNEYLLDYTWLSNELIHMTVRTKGRKKELLLELGFADEKVTVKSEQVDLKGYVVSTLENDPEHILFAKTTGKGSSKGFGSVLYKIPAKLINVSPFDEKYKVQNVPSDGAVFVYDDQLERLILLTYDLDAEQIRLEYKRLDEKTFTYMFSVGLEDYSFEPQGFISDTKLAVLSDKDSDKKILYEFDMLTQTFTDVLYEHQTYDVVSAQVSPESKALESVSFFDHGQLTRLYFDDKSKKQSELISAAFPGQQFVVIAEHEATHQKIINTFASHQPSTYYHFMEDEKVAELLFSQFPDLADYKFDRSERYQVIAEDGKVIESILTRPSSGDLQTLIVMPHGGPVGVREYDFFNPTVQYLTSRGFSVLRVNFRGSSGYGNEFMDQGVGQFGKLIEQDISLAVDKIRAQYEFKNLCAIGASYGGYSSFMLAIKRPDLYKCVVGSYGVYDLPLLFNYNNFAVTEEKRQATENIVGKMSDSLLDVSPVYLADKITFPSLLIAGTEDKVASSEHTRRMEYVLQKRGKQVSSVYYKGVGHGHQNWWGDWHENALIYQFLLQTLNLPQIPVEDIKAEDRKLIGTEYSRLAWAYKTHDTIDADVQKAFDFYQLAAKYGNASAMYSIAWFYEFDDEIAIDLEQAFLWYNKSAEAENAGALRRTGDFYYEGKWVEQDYTKAYQKYQKAKETGDHAGINMKLARAYCLGYGTEKNVERCAELLKLEELRKQDDAHNKVIDQSRLHFKEVLTEIILKGQFTESEYQILHATLSEEYDIEIFAPVVKEEEFGAVTKNADGKNQYSNTSFVPPVAATTVGSSFDVSSGRILAKKKRRSGLVGTWTLTYADQSTKRVYETFLWGNKYSVWSMHYALTEADLSAVSIELQLYDLYNRPIYSKQFAISSEDPALSIAASD